MTFLQPSILKKYYCIERWYCYKDALMYWNNEIVTVNNVNYTNKIITWCYKVIDGDQGSGILSTILGAWYITNWKHKIMFLNKIY